MKVEVLMAAASRMRQHVLMEHL